MIEILELGENVVLMYDKNVLVIGREDVAMVVSKLDATIKKEPIHRQYGQKIMMGEMEIGDVVALSGDGTEAGTHTTILDINKKEGTFKTHRPYTHIGDVKYDFGVIGYTGLETSKLDLRKDVEVTLLRPNHTTIR